MVRAFATAVAFFAAATASAQVRAVFTPMPGGVVAVALPPAILQSSAVRKQLNTGLTTTFIVIAKARQSQSRGGARIEVRYDLWDDAWIVRRVEFDRKIEQQRLASFDALTKWWDNPTRLIAASGEHVALDVELSVLPFSAAEEKDAREWISKSGGVGSPAAGGGGLVDALIGTTITARPITTYRWSVDLLLK
jgi:hypothetical protein